MESQKVNINTILLICLLILILIFGLLLVGSINNVAQEIHYQRSQMDSIINNMYNEIAYFEQSVSQMLTQQASIISSYDISYGRLDTNALTQEIVVKVTPKELSESGTAALYLNDKSYPMQRKGAAFIVTVSVPIMKQYDDILIGFVQDGIQRNEKINEQIDGSNNLIKSFYAYGDIGRWAHDMTSNKLTIEDAYVHIGYTPLENSFLKSARFFATVDGEQVWQKDMTDEMLSQAGDEAAFTFSKSFDINKGSTLTVYAEIEDGQGLVFRSAFFEATITEFGLEEMVSQTISVYDRNGNLIATY